MTYPLRTNYDTVPTVSAGDINNWSSLVNKLWQLMAGIPALPTARAATVGTEAFSLTAGSITAITGTTLDGVAVAVGDYVLVKDAPAASGVGSVGSSQPANGLYQITAVSTSITVIRAAQMSATGAAPTPAGMLVAVLAGTKNAGQAWFVSSPTSNAAFTYGTTAIQFIALTTAPAATQTLTNKRVQKRVTSASSTSTPAINTDICDVYKLTALAVPVTGWTITGTPADRDELWVVIKDNGTAQPLVWGAPFAGTGVAGLPAITTAGKKMTLKFIYDADDSTWRVFSTDLAGY